MNPANPLPPGANANNPPTADIAFHAKNLRTGQSISWRADEMFYLASTAKIPIHIRLWQLIENGHLNMFDTIGYTNGANTPDPYFVDNRSNASQTGPGLTSCNCNGTIANLCAAGRTSDLGKRLPLSRLDQAMMQVSDNAATSMLVDDLQLGLAYDETDLNEWLSGIPGVGRGFGVLTSIQNLDRLIVWRRQLTVSPPPNSLFLVPRGSLEAVIRTGGIGCGNDAWGTLAAWVQQTFQTTTMPNRGNNEPGFNDYFNMGLNSAEPRAMTDLIERFVNNEFTGSVNTRAALDMMTEGSSLRGLLRNFWWFAWPLCRLQ